MIPTPYPELSHRRVLTMSLISGCSLADRASVEATGWDVDALVHRAADIFLEMVFRDSFFHADPHPGNLRLPDASHVALLDFGDVGRLSGDRRTQLEDMVLAIGTRDVEYLVDVFIDMTSPSAGVDRSRLGSSIDAWLNRSLLDGVGEIDVSALIEGGMHILYDNDLVLPADLALLFRVLIRLQGLGREVNTEVRITELLESHVKPMLVERLNPAHAIGSAGERWPHGSTWLLRCPGRSRRSSTSSAPDNLDSTSASATLTGSSTRSSTVSWRPLRSSRLRSWSRAAPTRDSVRCRCPVWPLPRWACSPGDGSSADGAPTRHW